ncbi:hypothetical protein [Effusibacillus consociatus]|uniref:Uncharacterized protein n=1 Tax=Effusibacillus consociatus TaxID=1117041 RepID=A0ABV9QAE5_9BACL
MEKLLEQILGEVKELVQDMEEFKQEVRQEMHQVKLEIRCEVGKQRDQNNNRFEFLHQQMVKLHDMARSIKRDTLLIYLGNKLENKLRLK